MSRATPLKFLRRMSALGPVVVWDDLAVDEQDSREAQGTVEVSIDDTVHHRRATPG